MEDFETLLKRLQTTIDEALETAATLRTIMAEGARPEQARRLALVSTKLEEAELWLSKMW